MTVKTKSRIAAYAVLGVVTTFLVVQYFVFGFTQ